MNEKLKNAYIDHSRVFDDNKYLYPVLSRRAQGISVGFNLNQGKECNFDCVYCQIDRKERGKPAKTDLKRLEGELDRFLKVYKETKLQKIEKFKDLADNMLELKDFCLSGDGEPTLSLNFDEVCEILVNAKQEHKLNDIKFVVISNASLLRTPKVIKGLDYFSNEGHGEIWTKLDAINESTYRKINRSAVTLDKIKNNILESINHYKIRIQTLISTVNVDDFSGDNLIKYCDFIKKLHQENSSNLLEVQLYAPIRQVAEEYCKEISSNDFKIIIKNIKDNLKNLNIEINQY